MRLGDLDALLEKMKRRKDYVGRSSDPVCLVEDAPTVDAVPVVHGTWIPLDTNVAYDIVGVKTWALRARCSKCGFVMKFIEAHTGQYVYCPHCGAKMDKEKKEGDSE